MINIDDIEIDENIASVRFQCDVSICKGVCCTSPGGRGAPITDAEEMEIERAYPIIAGYLSNVHRRAAEQFGLTEGVSGNLATVCIDNAACIFVHYANGIAKCAFETAYLAHKIIWRKPLSCHLFPIRVHPSGKKIYYEFFEECHPALHAGAANDAKLQHVLHEPLERAFGKHFTDALHSALETITTKQK